MHIASAGGTWQMMVCGFGGFRVRNGRMTFKPWLPPDWTGIAFRLRLARQHGRRCTSGTDSATFELIAPDGAQEHGRGRTGAEWALPRRLSRSWSSWRRRRR